MENFRGKRGYKGEKDGGWEGQKKKLIAGGVLLTYDTTLQVVSGTAQEDLFLDGSLLWGHLGFLLLAGGEAAEVKREER
jgi:hypothetical protein